MASATRKQTPILYSEAGSFSLSASSQRPLRATPSLKSSTSRFSPRSTPDPLFSFSLAKISHDLTFGEWKSIPSERHYSRQLLKALSPFSGYHREQTDD